MINKNLLVMAFFSLALIFISSVSFSQQDQKMKTPEEFATKVADRLKQNLSLTDDQYKQVYELALTKAKDRMNNKEKYKDMDKEARKLLKKQSKEEFKEQLKGILNPDQIQKLEENKNRHKHNKNKKEQTK